MFFSSRLPKDLDPNEFSELLERKKASGDKILDLTQSNPTTVGFSYTREEALPLGTGSPGCYQPSAKGMESAREAIRQYYHQNRHGHIDSDDLLLTASTSEAYSYLFKLLTDPGDEILIPSPSYPLFDFLATLENVRPSRYLLREDASGYWRIDFRSLEEEVTPLTRAIVVVNPNNPTGSYLQAHELEKLTEICLAHDLALIVDEVFLDYPNPDILPKPLSVIGNASVLTFTMSGFSKVLALPQVKLSWIHINGPRQLQAMVKQRLEFIADTYLSVNSMVQRAAAELFSRQKDIRQEISTRIRSNEAAVQACPGLRVSPREGGWYAIINLPENCSDEDCCLTLLDTHSVVVHPGFFYDFMENNRIILSLITPEEDFRRGLGLLEHFVAAQYGRK